MTTRDRGHAVRYGGILGRLVSVLERLQRLQRSPRPSKDGPARPVETTWRSLVEPALDGDGQDVDGATLVASHELLPEHAFRECTAACSDLVVGLGEASTLGPLVELMRGLVPRGDHLDDTGSSMSNHVSAETVARLTNAIHAVATVRIVLACLEQADLYFSLEGARELVIVAVGALEEGRDVFAKRRGAGIRHRERVRQLSVLLQLEVIKVLVMMSRRYAEVFDEMDTGGALAGVLVGVWVESDEDSVPVSWVRDALGEVVRRESSLLQSVMSLMGSSMSLGFGKSSDADYADGRDGRDGADGADVANDPGTSGKADDNLAGSPNGSAGASPRGEAHQMCSEASSTGGGSRPPFSNAYDANHPLQSLSALLALLLCFTVPAFQLGLRDVISPTISPKNLLDTLAKRMAPSESSRLLMHVLLRNNEQFMNYCMSRTDVDVIVVPILERLYKITNQETTSMNELYIMVILLLVLTGDKAFMMSANGSVVKDKDTAWYTTRNIKGIRLDSLMLLVLLHVALVSTYSTLRRDVYLHTNTLATIANMAPTMADMHPVACQRLLGVLEKLGITEDRITSSLEVARDENDAQVLHLVQDFQRLIFEAINAIIANCLTENVELVYSMLHKRSAIVRYAEGKGDLRELSENALAVVEHFGSLLPRRDSQEIRDGPSEDPEPLSPSISVETIRETISKGMSSFRPEELPLDTSEALRFGFEEDSDSAIFFLSYIDDMLQAILL
jgi:hypothetical protein